MRVLLLSCLVAFAAAIGCGQWGCCAGSNFPSLGPGGMGCAKFAQCKGCEKVLARTRNSTASSKSYEDWNLETYEGHPPCCQELAKYVAKLQTEGFYTKLTPGGGCGSIKTCEKCNMLNFCAWNSVKDWDSNNSTTTNAGEYCFEVSKIPMNKQWKFTKTCKVKDNFVDVELHDPKPFEGPPDKYGFTYVAVADKTKFVNEPVVADHPNDWPVPFTAHLPANGCSKIDMSKYPSGIPGCHYQFEVMQGDGQFGNMDHGLPTDPRYPVETHVPQYPPGAHPNLPDKVAQNGGDFNAQPQEHSPWVIPDFNRNGCLGGPCDPHFLDPITDTHPVLHV